MHVQLGNIIYQGAKSFSSYSEELETLIAEHTVINRPAILQATAQGLRSINISIFLHQEFCSVAQECERLSAAQNNFEILPLLWGNGKVEGNFVISALSRTITQTDDIGNIISCTINLTLKQYIIDDMLAREQQEAQANAIATGDKQPPAKSTRVNPKSCPQQITEHVKIIKANANAVNGYMQSYNNDSNINHKLYSHLNIIIDHATRLSEVSIRPDSCAYRVTNLELSANNVSSKAKALRADIAFYIALIVKPVVIGNLQKMKNENSELQAAVRAVTTAASKILKSNITKR